MTGKIPLFCLCAAAAFTAAAGTVEFDVRPRVLRMGEHAVCTITVRGERRPETPRLPSVEGLRISEPSTQTVTQMQFAGGRTNREKTHVFQYRVVPLRPGHFTIGPVDYGKGAERVTLPAIELQVVDSRAAVQGKKDAHNLFARLHVDKTEIYRQEEFDLYLSLYYRDIDLDRHIELADMPVSGLAFEPFRELQPQRRIIDGEVYESRRFRARARALAAGTLTLEPVLRAQMLTRSAERDGRDPRGTSPLFERFFGRVQTTPVTVVPPPLALEVLALPEEGRPPGFTGAVGQFRFEAHADPLELRLGDPITITMTISGRGHLDSVTAPDLRLGDGFRVYDPLLAARDEQQKVFEQVLIPQHADIEEIPALTFSYFDPGSGRYQTIEQGPFALQIETPEPDAVLRTEAPAPPARVLGDDIVYLKPLPRRLPRRDGAWYAQPLFLALQPAPLLLFLALLAHSRHKQILARDTARRRRKQAPRIARHGLRLAEKALRQSNRRQFFEHLAGAMASYFGHRLNLPPGEALADRVLPALQRGGLPAEPLRQLEYIFRLSEQERFAGGSEADAETCRRLLRTLPGLLKTCERVRL